MYNFSARSLKNLNETHPDLRRLFSEVIKVVDCVVTEGHRSQVEQDKAFHAGKSRLKWPTSLHNHLPSLAVDVVPYPVNWRDIHRFYYFAGVVKGLSDQLKIPIRWGGDWDGDNTFIDQTFHDLPHFELR